MISNQVWKANVSLNLIIEEDNSSVGRILKALANFSVAAKSYTNLFNFS